MSTLWRRKQSLFLKSRFPSTAIVSFSWYFSSFFFKIPKTKQWKKNENHKKLSVFVIFVFLPHILSLIHFSLVSVPCTPLKLLSSGQSVSPWCHTMMWHCLVSSSCPGQCVQLLPLLSFSLIGPNFLNSHILCPRSFQAVPQVYTSKYW